MRASVLFRLPDGGRVRLGHGDLIGRLWSAALHLDDARVSEAHALVSLRGGDLVLLALRGRFAVGSQPLTEVVLKAGQSLLLARGLSLHVEAVVLPDHVLALEAEGLPRQLLSGVVALYAGDPPRLHRGHRPDADALLWDTGAGWRAQVGAHPPVAVVVGTTLLVAGRPFRAVAMPVERAGAAQTVVKGGVQAPLRIVSYFDTVHLHVEGQPAVQLRGQAARIVAELVSCGAPVSWQALARVLWPDLDAGSLRRRWDVAVSKLRSRLRANGIRPDLISASGDGLFELLLYERDEVEDRG